MTTLSSHDSYAQTLPLCLTQQSLWRAWDRHTSKKPEKGEVEGVHFFFVKKELMQKMAEGGQLVEWGEGQGGTLTGTAATSLHQVCMRVLHSCKVSYAQQQSQHMYIHCDVHQIQMQTQVL